MLFGLICPVDAELKPFLENLTDVKVFKRAMLVFYTGKICGKSVAAVSCGVGRVNAAIAAQILIDGFKAGAVIVSGTAGAIDKSLRIGDTVVSEEAAYHDLDEKILTEYHPKMASVFMKADRALLDGFKRAAAAMRFPQKVVFGRVVTGESFIEKEGRAGIIEKFRPLCVDMETAGVAHACYLNGVPFIAVRSVTDTEENGGMQAFRENCALAARNSYAVTEGFLRGL